MCTQRMRTTWRDSHATSARREQCQNYACQEGLRHFGDLEKLKVMTFYQTSCVGRSAMQQRTWSRRCRRGIVVGWLIHPVTCETTLTLFCCLSRIFTKDMTGPCCLNKQHVRERTYSNRDPWPLSPWHRHDTAVNMLDALPVLSRIGRPMTHWSLMPCK